MDRSPFRTPHTSRSEGAHCEREIEIFFRFLQTVDGWFPFDQPQRQWDRDSSLLLNDRVLADQLVDRWQAETNVPSRCFSYYFTGLASEEELIAHIEKQRKAAEAKRNKAESAKIC